ncbi:unnamed protein product [Pylaiella littoralis]
MQLYQLLVTLFLVTPWYPVLAFRPRVPLPRQRNGSNDIRHASSSKRKHPAAGGTATTSSSLYNASGSTTLTSTTTTMGPSPLSRDLIPQRHDKGGSGPTAARRSVATQGRRSSSAAGVDVTKSEKCGASSFSLIMTRSQILSSTASVVAGLVLAAPRQVSAAESAAVMAPDTQELVSGGSGEGAAAKYMVGSDEVGVLFGDGPIGIKLGDNPLKASGVCRVYVTEVLKGSQAIRQADLRAGFGVAAVGGKAAEKLEPKEVAELIRVSPRPMEIVFRDPDLLGKRLQLEADKKAEAARRRKRKAADDAASTAPPETETTAAVDTRSGTVGGGGGSSGELRVTQVGEKPKVCGTRTKAGDLIEFRYSARLASDLSVEFDSSDRRGTGLPYAIVLGNGDVVKGLDLSLFDMCVGERRKIEVPARLAYGKKGSKVFGIPPDDGTGSADVVFGVELVSINFSINSSDVRDNFYTDDACDAAAVAAGNASGQCKQ